VSTSRRCLGQHMRAVKLLTVSMMALAPQQPFSVCQLIQQHLDQKPNDPPGVLFAHCTPPCACRYFQGGWSYHEGEEADSRMTAAASRRGVVLTSRSRPLQPLDLSHFQYIIGKS
jgi:hypothetical protein